MTAKAKSIQNGIKTIRHDQSITLTNFKIINTIWTTPIILTPPELLEE